MKNKGKKLGYSDGLSHRMDLGSAGRSLFVSRDKQAQDKQAHKIHILMRVVIALVILALAAVAGFFVFGYLVPYFHSEFSLEGEAGSSPAVQSHVEVSTPVFDELGLPVFDNAINLYVVNYNSPRDTDAVPELAELEGIQLQKNIVPATNALVDAAKEDGLALSFSKGYVSYEDQEKLFTKKVEELEREGGLSVVMARNEAKTYVPAPGECDDQSGLCLTVSGDSATFGKSQTYQWLKTNMGRYGFIFRYPQYKEDATNHVQDDTVIRYVGAANAEAAQRLSMCLEEYVSYVDSQ